MRELHPGAPPPPCVATGPVRRRYFTIGGACVRGPVGMLAGLTPSPAILIAHFFCVAAVALRRVVQQQQQQPGGSWAAGARRGAAVLREACSIIMPLLRQEHVTALSWPAVQRALRVAIPWTVDI